MAELMAADQEVAAVERVREGCSLAGIDGHRVASGMVHVAPRAHLHLVIGLDLVIAENGVVSDLASVSEHEADGLAPADSEAVRRVGVVTHVDVDGAGAGGVAGAA